MNESAGERPEPVRHLRASILELMWLVAAVAVAIRWPGLTVPVSLLFLYTLAHRREILRRQTHVALGQMALAVYLPPVLGFLGLDLWGRFGPPDERQYWAFVGWDHFLSLFVGRLSLVPAFIPAFLIMSLLGIPWADNLADPPNLTVALAILSLSPLAVIGGLGMIAKRGMAWRIPCLIVASGMSALSTFALYVISVAGA
jgi:hypothetical protein